MSFDRESALARLSAELVGHLATTTPSGAPHIVPITFAVEGAFLFTIVDQKPKSTTSLKRLTNIGHQPMVSVLVDEYHDDWTRLWWVRVDGEASVVESGSNWSLAQRLLMSKYHQYVADPPVGPAIVVAIERVTSWEWAP
ncbi:MAG TPA: TIGR03668 family PPOX class F420-dependent oxidoreductase [Acidimicrobiia bacterium]